jgi:hypothetical protein
MDLLICYMMRKEKGEKTKSSIQIIGPLPHFTRVILLIWSSLESVNILVGICFCVLVYAYVTWLL